MEAITVFKTVLETKTAHLVRVRKNETKVYDIKEAFTGNKRGWIYVDVFTASAVMQLHAKLDETVKAKYENLSLMRIVDIAWGKGRKAA
jgi:hypothetical protein